MLGPGLGLEASFVALATVAVALKVLALAVEQTTVLRLGLASCMALLKSQLSSSGTCPQPQ